MFIKFLFNKCYFLFKLTGGSTVLQCCVTVDSFFLVLTTFFQLSDCFCFNWPMKMQKL